MKLAGVHRPWETESPTPVGINVGVGVVSVVAAANVAAMIPAADGGWRFGTVAVAVGVFAAVTVDRVALAGVVAMAWLVVNAFLVNRLGHLFWHGSPDLWRLTLLAVTGAVGLGVGGAYRQLADLREKWRAEAELRALAVYEERTSMR
jgi:hypothetical protein